MAVTRLDFDNVNVADLQELVDAGATESQVLEFKRDAYGGADADKKELLKDVSSFANTHGGHLLMGIEAAQGVAIDVIGVAVPDIDAEVVRLDSIVRSGSATRNTLRVRLRVAAPGKGISLLES